MKGNKLNWLMFSSGYREEARVTYYLIKGTPPEQYLSIPMQKLAKIKGGGAHGAESSVKVPIPERTQIGCTTIIIDDIQEGRNEPKRHPIKLALNDKEKPRCDFTFAYDFDKAENFTKPAEQLTLNLPLSLIDEEKHIGKADGLTKVQEFLPFHSTHINDFIRISQIDKYQELNPEDIESKF